MYPYVLHPALLKRDHHANGSNHSDRRRRIELALSIGVGSGVRLPVEAENWIRTWVGWEGIGEEGREGMVDSKVILDRLKGQLVSTKPLK